MLQMCSFDFFQSCLNKMEWEIKNTQLISTLGVRGKRRGRRGEYYRCTTFNKCIDWKKEIWGRGGERDKKPCLYFIALSKIFTCIYRCNYISMRFVYSGGFTLIFSLTAFLEQPRTVYEPDILTSFTASSLNS